MAANKFSGKYVTSKPGWVSTFTGEEVPFDMVSSNPNLRREQGLMPIKYNYLTRISSGNGTQQYAHDLEQAYLNKLGEIKEMTTPTEKIKLFQNAIKKTVLSKGVNDPSVLKKIQNSLMIKNGLSNYSNLNNTPAANGTVSKGWRKWLYNQTIGRCVGPKCKNTGGRRTRRAKSRRVRRTRRS